MDDSYLVANFHNLCRLCLNKNPVMIQIFENTLDEESGVPLTSKIADSLELHMEPNDGLPGRICYKCLYKLEKCSKFRLLCIQSDTRLRQVSGHVSIEADNSHSSELSHYNYASGQDAKPKNDNYVVEDSVVMVVDPSLDYDSSDHSENGEVVEKESPGVENTNEVEHIADSFFKNVFMCQYCDQAFITYDKCKEHEQAYHDPNLPYNCTECGLVFAERTQHIQHSRQVHCNDKPYQCPECEKSFGRRSDLRKHSIVHTGIRPFQCHYCLKSFSRNTNLSKHLRIHSGQKPHVCPLCPRSFVAKGDLQRHVLVHSGMKPYTCRKCPLTFGRRDKLIKHEMRHGIFPTEANNLENEQNDNMVVNVNPYGNMVSSSQESNHTQSDHYDLPSVPDHIAGDSSFANQVQKMASTSKKLEISPSKPKTPVNNKNRPKNIKCHQCPKRFASLDAYKTHVSIHMGLRNFQCKVCFKKFGRKRELDRHAALHTGFKPFSCTQCDKSFTRRDKLTKHEQTHDTNVSTMPCIECGATFEKKADLVAHIKSHFSDDFETKCDDVKKEDYPLDDNYYEMES